jgi:predicted ArsR family transcriptional regulator
MTLSVDATPVSLRSAMRHEEILSTLELAGHASASDLESRLGVTAVTIREDLKHLEQLGHITRARGGALVKSGRTADLLITDTGANPEILKQLKDPDLETETVEPDGNRGLAKP